MLSDFLCIKGITSYKVLMQNTQTKHSTFLILYIPCMMQNSIHQTNLICIEIWSQKIHNLQHVSVLLECCNMQEIVYLLCSHFSAWKVGLINWKQSSFKLETFTATHVRLIKITNIPTTNVGLDVNFASTQCTSPHGILNTQFLARKKVPPLEYSHLWVHCMLCDFSYSCNWISEQKNPFLYYIYIQSNVPKELISTNVCVLKVSPPTKGDAT
jgi:hypothetical protein